VALPRVYRRYASFRNGREDLKDDARSGRPSTARTDGNVEYVRRLLTEDRRNTPGDCRSFEYW